MVAVNRLQPTIMLADLLESEREPVREAGKGHERKDSTATVGLRHGQA